MDFVHISESQESPAGRQKAAFGDIFFRVVNRWHLIFATQLLDFGLIMLVAGLVYPITVGRAGDTLHYMSGAAVIAIICHFYFAQGHLYHINALLNETKAVKSIILRVSLVFMALAAIAALTHQQALFSRVWFVAFYGGVIVATAVGRSVVAALIRSWIARGYITQNVVIVGDNELTGHLIDRFKTNRFGIRIAGVFDDRTPDNGRVMTGNKTGELARGGVGDLLAYASHNTVDLVVVTLPITATDRDYRNHQTFKTITPEYSDPARSDRYSTVQPDAVGAHGFAGRTAYYHSGPSDFRICLACERHA